ncbi:MAG: hypothetical protein K2X86_05820 [Cytophagaceae bacterium]|nr:hypothetical protein [Cytophagaceae bacterium]
MITRSIFSLGLIIVVFIANAKSDLDSLNNAKSQKLDKSEDSLSLKKRIIIQKEKLSSVGDKISLVNIKPSNKGIPIQFSGYARAFLQYRLMDKYYAGVNPRDISFNGVDVKDGIIYQTGTNNIGYPEPLIYLRAQATPTPNTSFLVDFFFDNQLLGSNSTGRVISNYRNLQFVANTRNSVGNFKLIAGGGVNWYRLSPFTLWNYEYRDDLFERYPWEPEEASFYRYERYYTTQNIPRDIRWGNTGTQGFILEASNLPAGFGAKVLYGKTDNSGSFSGFLTSAPRNMFTGRIEKSFGALGKHKAGINYFDQFGFIDNLGEEKVTQTIITGDLRLNFKGVNLFSEFGIGGYKDRFYDYGWGTAINIQGEFDRTLTKIPATLQFYYIDKSVINVNSLVLNTSHPNLQQIYGSGESYTITTYQGSVPEFGQLTNNRTGGYLKVFESVKRNLKFILGTGVSKEIDHLNDRVTLYHRVNGFPRSRFIYFQNNVGPYSRIMSIFRRTFEHFNITDTSDFKKAFNVVDLTLKYKMKFWKRDLILSNYITYNSVQGRLSAIPVFSQNAYYRQFYEEIIGFYRLFPKINMVGFFGIEKIIGNNRTEFAPNGKPVDQTGIGYGIGFDYEYAPRAGFYVRHRWFSQEDKNFVLDRFKGQETSFEVKIFF